MQIRINVKDNLTKDLKRFRQQIPFAIASSLTKTISEVKTGVIKQAEKDIDRPKPFTLNGFSTITANKSNLKAKVYIKDIQANYLKYQIDGGTRIAKKAKPIIVPSKKIRLDRYGNIAKNRLRGSSKRNLFVKNGVIYQRYKRSVKNLAKFSDRAEYNKRFRYYERAMDEAKSRFKLNWTKSIANAISTAR